MSVQFGQWNFGGAPPEAKCLESVGKILAPYGPDQATFHTRRGIEIIHRAFHTTAESRGELQPYVSRSGAVITWDGRLDNPSELSGELGGSLSPGAADVRIVSEAYERWGIGSFGKLIGEWALSIWNPRERFLLLAKDLVGTEPLYYSVEDDRVTWSSLLEPLVLLARNPLKLDEEYMAGWLSFFPAAHRTPYQAIESVPPSSYVQLEKGRRSIRKYWDFDPAKRFRYGSDREYEEHFRCVFRQAVKRRLRSDAPILAELSGGIDSSSIVSIADGLADKGEAGTPRIDTVSYYNDSEPNLDEQPYFTEIERQRNRTGCHIDLGTEDPSPWFDFRSERFASTPASGSGYPRRQERELQAYMESHGNRVILSGIGGDEVTGGVPTPLPELQDLIVRVKSATLAKQLNLWALANRKPWSELLLAALGEFLPRWLSGPPRDRRPANWLRPDFVRRNQRAFEGYEPRRRFFGPLPSFQSNLNALEMLRRQLGTVSLSSTPLFEKRYPFLDRDLLEFLYAIPREQITRPGERRSLLRRSLKGIVPDKVLDRRRKAFVARAPLKAIERDWPILVEKMRSMSSARLGWVDRTSFSDWLERARDGRQVPLVPLLRTLYLESWLEHVFDASVATELGPLGERLLRPTTAYDLS